MRRNGAAREIAGAVVVITGASSGIGRAAAHAFAARSAHLVLAARDPTPLEVVAAECRLRGSTALAVPTDVRDRASVEALAKAAMALHGRIDAWVNDAGVYMLGTVEDTPAEAVRELFDTNLMGVLHGSQIALASFRAQGRGGVIINVGSVAGEMTYAKAGPYCASEHAVHALTEALRQETLGTDVDVCLVAPPSVDTPLFQHSANFTGRAIVAFPPLVPSERVAEAILASFERPRARRVVGVLPKLMIWAYRLVPRLMDRLQPTFIEHAHLRPEPAPMSLGNVMAPREPHATTGGWEDGHADRPPAYPRRLV